MINDVPVNLFRDAVDFHRIRFINCIEQRRKGIAQVETASAAMTNIEDTLQLLEERSFGVKLFGLPVQRMPGWRLKAAFASSVRHAIVAR